MNKINSISNVFKCNFCNAQLEDPIHLPCFETICRKDSEKLLGSADTFQCTFCEQTHTRPVNGFPSDKRLKNLLDLQLNQINFAKMFTHYDACIFDLSQLNAQLDTIESIEKEPDDFIYSYFEDIINQVDIQRDKLNEAIEDYSEELVKTLQKIKSQFQLSIKAGKITVDVNSIRRSLNELSQIMNSFDINDLKIAEIIEAAAQLKPKIASKLNELQSNLLGYKSFEFVPNEINVKNIFGHFYECRLDSLIIKGEIAENKLMELCELSSTVELRLVYRATRDGFASKCFHQKCDGVKNTLTIVKTDNGFVFGGFTQAAWSSTSKYVFDKNAFIYSLVNESDAPIKIECSQPEVAIYCSANYGPTFGTGHCFNICDHSNTNSLSYSNWSESYKHPTHASGSNEAKIFLAGSSYFQTAEIEVFVRYDKIQ